MGIKFTAGDIVEMGLQIEKNGREYYKEVGKCSSSGKARAIFDFLGKEEQRHINYFDKLLEKTEKEEIAESYPGEYHEYMQHLSGLHVFTQEGKGKEAACKIKGDLEALQTAAGFEKDSILFYYEMRNFIAEKDKHIIDGIIKQEQLHLSKIMELVNAMNH